MDLDRSELNETRLRGVVRAIRRLKKRGEWVHPKSQISEDIGILIELVENQILKEEIEADGEESRV